MALINTLTPEQREAYAHEKELKAGRLAFSLKRDKQDGSVEAVAIGSTSRKGYAPRFKQSEMSTGERFKLDLFYSLRGAYCEYQQLLASNGGPEYLRGTKATCAKFVSDAAKGSIFRFQRFGLFTAKEMERYGNAIEQMVSTYDLGQDGKRGTYMMLCSTEIYDKAIAIINL
jgi:hypothetical protein